MVTADLSPPPSIAAPDPFAHLDPWGFWKGKRKAGGGKGSGTQPEGVAHDAQGDIEKLIAKAVQEALAGSAGISQAAATSHFSDHKARLDERNVRRVQKCSGSIEEWAEWAFVFKAATRAACLDMFQMLEWFERQELGISTERLSDTFLSVHNVEKLGGELFDLSCTI